MLGFSVREQHMEATEKDTGSGEGLPGGLIRDMKSE